LKRNPTSRWVDFKSTHQLDGCTQKSTPAHPLAWGNKKRTQKKKKKQEKEILVMSIRRQDVTRNL
jgi:hypothetical protein